MFVSGSQGLRYARAMGMQSILAATILGYKYLLRHMQRGLSREDTYMGTMRHSTKILRALHMLYS